MRGVFMDENEILYREKNAYLKCIIGYVVGSFILASLVISFIAKLISNDIPIEDKNKVIMYSNIIVSTLISFGLSFFFYIILRDVLKKDIIKIKKNLKLFILLVLFSFLFVYLGEYLCSLFYSLFDMELTSNNQDSIVQMLQTPLKPVMIFHICITGPIVEEVIFRKCIFGFFKKNILPLIISSLVFGLLHVIATYDFIHILPYVITGLIFGGIYVLSKRNIYACILAHMIANTVSLILILV